MLSNILSSNVRILIRDSRKKIKKINNLPIKYNYISVKNIHFPRKDIDSLNEIEKKQSILKIHSKEFQNISMSFYEKKLKEHPKFNSHITFNNSYSKFFKSKFPKKSLLKYKKFINEDLILFPQKKLLTPIKHLNEISIVKTRNNNLEEKINIKKEDLNSNKENILLINNSTSPKINKILKIRNSIKSIVYKNKSEINCLSKKIPLKIGNFSIDYSQIENIEVNKNNISFPLNQNINNPLNCFYYSINQMYYNQISNYFKHRINWILIQSKDDPNFINANFQWKYYSNKISFKRFIYNNNLPMKKLKMTNLFERNYELGNKKHFFMNLVKYCDQNKINVFDIVPFTIIFSHTKVSFEEQFKIFTNIFHIVKENIKNNNHIILNKSYSEVFDYEKHLIDLKNTPIYINKEFISEYNYWIIKPSDLYQGKCIEINNDYKEIFKICKKMFQGVDKRIIINNIEETIENKENEIMNKNNKENEEIKPQKKYSTMHCSNDIIIQKYLDNPLLYNNRKFDIRCFVLVDSNFNVFYCKEGHLKGSSEEYNLNNTNKFIHITNHSIQKKSIKFEKYEFGNEISYNDFKKYLQKENISLNKFNELINDMKNMILISMNSVKNKLNKTKNVLCFEIFGYDFIIDKNFKPWILEINNNPGLGISSPLIQKLIPRMLDDAFRLTIDKVFDTKYDSSCFIDGKYISKFKLDGFDDSENIFEFLCNISI